MKKKHHIFLYFFEFGLLGLGFAFLLTTQMAFVYQLLTLGFILASYVLIGLMHHNSHHDITTKVVLEYILISAVICALFIFLNVTRI